jgi:hypothetical protein
MYFLNVNEKPTNAFIIQYIGAQSSATCFGNLKCHNQGFKRDRAEMGSHVMGSREEWELCFVTGGMMVSYSDHHAVCYNIQLPFFSASHDMGCT